jgi:hypothetical protein
MAEYCALTPMSFHPMSGADACGIDTANMTQDHSNRDGAGLTDPLGTCIMQSGLELCPRPTRGLYAHTKPTGAFQGCLPELTKSSAFLWVSFPKCIKIKGLQIQKGGPCARKYLSSKSLIDMVCGKLSPRYRIK